MTEGQGPQTTAVAVKADRFLALREDPKALVETMRANVGAQALTEFDLDRLRVPAGGATQWTVPGLEETQAATVEGVVVAWRDPRSYWAAGLEESGGGTPPDCSSPDGVRGVGTPGGDCASCPMNEWGSARKDGKEARGKACKETRAMFLLRDGDRLPVVVVAPPSSLKNVRKYFLRLASQGVPYHGVVTRFALARTKNQGGIAYSEIVPAFAGKLDAEAAARVRAYAEAMAPAFARASVDRRDVEAEAEP